MKGIIVENESKLRYKIGSEHIQAAKELESKSVEDAIKQYFLAFNQLTISSRKMNNSVTCFPQREYNLVIKFLYIFKKLKLLNYKSNYLNFTEKNFKNFNSSPIELNETSLNILRFLNMNCGNAIKEFRKRISENSLTKSDRFNAEKNGIVLNWAINIRSKEFKRQLYSQMEQNFDEQSLYFFFSSDFRYQYFLLEYLINLPNKENLIDNLDVILKWCTLILIKKNPILIYKVLEYLSDLFKYLRFKDYQLKNEEFNSFVPYLLRKFNDPRPLVQEAVGCILKFITYLDDPKKICDLLIDMAKKNDTEAFSINCVELLGFIIDDNGLEVLNYARIIDFLIENYNQNKFDEVRNSSLKALAISKKDNYNILKEYISENDLREIPDNWGQVKFLIKITEIKQVLNKLEPFIIKNCEEISKLILNILDDDIDISISSLCNMDIFLISINKIKVLSKYVDAIVFACCIKLESTITKVYKTNCDHDFELVEKIFETLCLIFESNLVRSLEKSNVKFLIFKFLKLITIGNDEFLRYKLKDYLNFICDYYDETKISQALFELLNDAINNKIPNFNVKNSLDFYSELKILIDNRNREIFENIPEGKMVADVINISEMLLFFDSIFSENPTENWNDENLTNDLDKCIQFMINLTIKTHNIMDHYQLVSDMLSSNTEIKIILEDIIYKIQKKT